MSQALAAYRTFIASPGGLEPERDRFRSVLREYNDTDAHLSAASFIPCGWEDVPSGHGRPQNLINELVRDSSMFVLVLHDRWGTPTFPGDSPAFSSGVEEELEIARQCLADPSRPMRKVVVLFKSVDPALLAEPTPDLKKVLDFRRELETSKEVLYEVFDDLSEFERRLRRHLGAWLQAHRLGWSTQPASITGPLALPDPPTLKPHPVPLDDDTRALIAEAEACASHGQLVDAELTFSKAIARGPSIASINQFGIFLYRTGRLTQAAAMFERVRDMAHSSRRADALVAAAANLGWVAMSRVDLVVAETSFRETLELCQATDDLRGQAGALGALGMVFFRRGDTGAAEKMFDSSLRLAERLNWAEGAAIATGNLGLVYVTTGRFDEAQSAQRRCIEMYENLGRPEAVLVATGNLGVVHRNRGEYQEATQCYEAQLKAAEHIGNPEAAASARSNLGIIAVETGRFGEAESLLIEATAIAKAHGFPDIASNALGNMATLRRLQGRLDEALALQQEAIALDESLGRRESLSNAYAHLGEIYLAQRAFGEAREALNRALHLARAAADPGAEADALIASAHILIEEGQLEEAEARIRASFELNTRLGRHWQTITATANLGFLKFRQGDFSGAVEVFSMARDLARTTANPALLGQITFDLGMALRATDREKEAAAEFLESASQFRASKDRRAEVLAFLECGKALACSADFLGAEARFTTGRDLTMDAGLPDLHKEAMDLLDVLQRGRGKM